MNVNELNWQKKISERSKKKAKCWQPARLRKWT